MFYKRPAPSCRTLGAFFADTANKPDNSVFKIKRTSRTPFQEVGNFKKQQK